MSRIGKSPINVPKNVKVQIDGPSVTVEGPLGKNTRVFDNSVNIEFSDGIITVNCIDPENEHSRVMQGTVRSIINSMVIGVVDGYSKSIEISGVGFKAIMKSPTNLLLDLGYSHDIIYTIPAGIKIEIDSSGTKFTLKGVNKEVVGQVAADIKRFYPVEPYKGKGVRILGEFVRRKEGKKTA